MIIPGYLDFEFDLPEALLAKLIDVFKCLPSATLEKERLVHIPDAQGVYQLFFEGELVYIGKTDGDAGLRKRLERHQFKIQHRTGLDPTKVEFKAVRIFVFTAMDLETLLIDHYGGVRTVKWNGSGFGSNDPGRQRDTTQFKSDHFDMLFPVDIDRKLDFVMLPGGDKASNVLETLKRKLPYVFRFETCSPKHRGPHSDLVNVIIQFPTGSQLTTREIIVDVIKKLPPGWQAVRLPSHIILYKNDSRLFPHGEVIASSPP